MFAVYSFRLVCSALRPLCTLAESTVMFRAFLVSSGVYRAGIPCADRNVSTRTRTLVVVLFVQQTLNQIKPESTELQYFSILYFKHSSKIMRSWAARS